MVGCALRNPPYGGLLGGVLQVCQPGQVGEDVAGDGGSGADVHVS